MFHSKHNFLKKVWSIKLEAFRKVLMFIPFDLIYFQQDATLHILFISGKLLYMFRVVSPPIIRSRCNCIDSVWYLSNRYCYLPQ